MVDWENLRYFAALAQSRTLLGAARALGVEHATVARRVANLETQMGAKLVDRRGRRLSLTPEGVRVAALAERMGLEAAAAERAALARDGVLEGHVTISAPPALAGMLLAPRLVELQAMHPGLEITLLGQKRLASLGRREADVAVRLGRPEEGDLSVSCIGKTVFRFHATSSYLAAHPQEAWRFIAYDDGMSGSPQQQLLLQAAGDRKIALKGSTLEFQMAAARAGGGIAILPDFLVAHQPDLVEVPFPGAPLTREIWLAVHSDVRKVPVVRAVMGALKAAWRAESAVAVGHDLPIAAARPPRKPR